jgi:hypothetical protein
MVARMEDAVAFAGPGRNSPATLRDCVRAFSSYSSPRTLAGIVAVALATRLWLGSWSLADLAIAGGFALFWPLNEWLIHVFILHWRPLQVGGRTLDFHTPKTHRAHHREPWRLDLVLIPLRVYSWAPLLIGAAWLALAPTTPQALTGIAIHFALSLHYEWVHFLTHTRYRPRSRHYERLWRNHRLHHFKNEHYWYGVTMTSGDRWLGTAPRADAVPTSPTARSLGFERTLDPA